MTQSIQRASGETIPGWHGRNESRYYYPCPRPQDLPGQDRWAKLKAIGVTINITQRDGKETGEVRYYILRKYFSGRRFAEAVRGHWSIENSLHWQLDVSFGEVYSHMLDSL